MSRYALEHTDTAGATHRWTVGDLSAHWVARWLAQDSGVPFDVLRDGRLVCTWLPDGHPDPPDYRPHDEDDDEDDPDSPPGSMLSVEQGVPRGTGTPNPQRTIQRATTESRTWSSAGRLSITLRCDARSAT